VSAEGEVEQIRFVLCIHNHQPIGNFDDIFEMAYERAYRPFLDVMDRFPTLPWVLHNSGCLWEWLEAHHPEYIERIGRGVAGGRIELLAGGFYEPVLPALSPEDRRGQIRRMREYLQRRFGVAARGLWLTERVWEPDLPLDLTAEGIEYLPLDDTQLLQVGVAPEAVRAPFHTESAGRALRLFPALMSLRYRIPYADPLEAVAFLRDPFPGGGPGLAVYADDGEKFGVWPGTHKLLYEERWLQRFLEGLERAGGRVVATTFEAEASAPGAGLVYLPTGSYAEMGQWSLPPEAQAGWERARQALRDAGMEREAELFVRGGFWRNFFARYPESHWMNMRALDASRRCEAAREALPAADWARARDHLWRAQCNCAYWHGVFGGLYLPHLRDGIYREIVSGEAILARAAHGAGGWVAAGAADLDRDGREEWTLENDASALFLDPGRGGRLVEWDDRAVRANLVNPMTRRPEHYHAKIDSGPEKQPAEPETIHAAVRSREAGLRDLLTYDRYPRAALLDRVFAAPPAAAVLRREAQPELIGLPDLAYEAEGWSRGAEAGVRLRRRVVLPLPGEPVLEVEKSVLVRPGVRGFDLAVRYRNLGGVGLRAWAGLEILVNLLAGHADDRYVLIDGARAANPYLDATADHPAVRAVALVDAWRKLSVDFTLAAAASLVRYPVETVSLSEAGAERVFQGSVLVFVTPLELTPGCSVELALTARAAAL
jgi:4-alpha-glucanotransferase